MYSTSREDTTVNDPEGQTISEKLNVIFRDYLMGYIMATRLDQLEEILNEVRSSPKDVPPETRKRFWRIVREIKRDPDPDPEEIRKAAEIRDILFEIKRGRTLPLAPTLTGMFLAGIFFSVIPYLYLLTFPLDWFSILSWSLDSWWIFILRFITLFLGITFFYPIGRLIGSKYTGIKVVGVCRDDFYEPTLKIDYVTFLSTPPPKRKWFYFFGGIWTVITSIIYLIVGIIIAMDFTGLLGAMPLFLFEAYVLLTGQATYRRGEMGLFNREKKIERAWRKNLATH